MSLLEKLRKLNAPAAPAPRPVLKFQKPAEPVSESDELERIMALPRRPLPSEEEMAEMARKMTARLRRENAKCRCAELRPEVVARGQNPCITSLRPVQGWYLTEAEEMRGASGLIAIGAGKTGIDVLTAMVFPHKPDGSPILAVLLIRPSELAQFQHDYECWSQHFQVPNLVGGPGPFVPGRPRLEVLPYSQLSLQKNATWLKARVPDLFIGDEVQALKDPSATRTGRFLRYCADNEDTVRMCCHSGSFTTHGVEDFSHLLAVSLRQASPMPLDPTVVETWGEAINPAVSAFVQSGEGALKKLCRPGENVRQALHRRIVETKGVIATSDASVEAKLVIKEAEVGEVPEAVLAALKAVRRDEQRPDGEELMDQMEVAAVCAQVACGFYYRWKFPRGESEELIDKWFARRKAWNAEVREMLQDREDGMDSPGLIRAAAERQLQGYEGPLPKWRSDTLAGWLEVEELVKPEPDFVWIDDFLARACARWATEGEPGIVWYGFREFGRRVEELTGLQRFGGGEKASAEIRRVTGERSIIASIKAHGTGKNLQHAFWRNLVANAPADWEQLLGRTHRSLQPREVVEAYVFRHTEEPIAALEKATEFAQYIQDITGNPQRLLSATYTFSK